MLLSKATYIAFKLQFYILSALAFPGNRTHESAYAHPVRRMMRLKQHGVTARSSGEVQSTEERDIDV